MTMGQSGAAQRLLGVLFEAGAVGGLTDAELLERFVARHPATAELAFAVLVERHGPLVERVCRGIVRDVQAAEDAFQSTFLVLVKKAPSLRVRTSLAPWIHAVAYRVACEARANAARRIKHERRVAELRADAPRVESDPREELERQLHEEIAKLTELHRQPIVLCDLEGLTHEQAARLLGTPVGTIKSRLARGRERLRDRLSRRRLELSGSVMSAALEGRKALADAQSALVDRTARLAIKVAESDGLVAGTVPASVEVLVRGVLKSMFRARLKTVAAAIATTAVIAIGMGLAARGLLAQTEPVRTTSGPPPVTTQGAGMRDLAGSAGLVRSVAFSRDGRFLIGALAPPDDDKQPGEIRLWDAQVFKPLAPLKLDGDPFAMAVAPDSRTVAVAISAVNRQTVRR